MFDNDPIKAISYTVADMMSRQMEPIKRDIQGRENDGLVDELYEKNYKEYGDFRTQVRQELKKDKVLSALGEKGVKAAYDRIIGQSLPQIIKEINEKNSKGGDATSSAPAGTSTGGSASAGENKDEAKTIHDKVFAAGGGTAPFLKT